MHRPPPATPPALEIPDIALDDARDAGRALPIPCLHRLDIGAKHRTSILASAARTPLRFLIGLVVLAFVGGDVDFGLGQFGQLLVCRLLLVEGFFEK